MYNYNHEITCPDNKGIRSFLWDDHFHDSAITDISFGPEKNVITLTLDCCFDLDEIWDKLKGDDDARRTYIDEHKDHFTYKLAFKGVRHFQVERLFVSGDYINGRFKDTALLRKKIAEINNSPLYHFRIQTHGGYIDIIFSDFTIRKKAGRVRYHTVNVESREGGACSMSFAEDDDYERVLAMQKCFRENKQGLLEIARQHLRLADGNEDSCLYSAYLLGKLGDSSDIPKLFDLYLSVEKCLGAKTCSILLLKRNIMDSIEAIQYRQRQATGDKESPQ